MRLIMQEALRTPAAYIAPLAAILFIAASACNAPEPTADLSDISVDGTTPATADGDEGSSARDAVPRYGGTLNVLLGCNYSLDPAVGDCHELYHEVYARLTSITDDPSIPIVLDLAETYSVSPDGMTYTFTMRRDLKFSDGTPLTALDFKWSWERALNPETGSAEAHNVLGTIKGADVVASGDVDTLQGVTAADDRTLVVELTAPSPLFIYRVADHVAAPLSRSNTEDWQVDIISQPGSASSEGTLPVGTGPFRVAELGTGMRIDRNPHYYGTQPLLDEVIYVPLELQGDSAGQFDVAGAMLTMFESGEIDISPLASSSTETPSGTNTSRTLSSSIGFLAFNTAVSPLDDVHVRRAIIAASNAAEHQDPSAAFSLLWEGLPGYDAELAVDRYDPDVATDELAASSYTSFDTLTLCHWTNRSGGTTFRVGVADLLNDWKTQLGIEAVELELAEDECVNDAAIIAAYIEPAFPDPHAVLGPAATLFGEDLQVQLDEIAGIADTVSRFARYSEIERQLHEEALVLPLSQSITTITEHVRNNVRGYDPGPHGGSLYSSVWLDARP